MTNSQEGDSNPLDPQKPPLSTPPPPPASPADPGGPGGGAPGEPPASGKTNVLAIVSLISAFFISILAIILGHISLSQIKKTGEKGRGLALTGTILGYVFTAIGLIVAIVMISTMVSIGNQVDDYSAELEDQLEEIDEEFEDDNDNFDEDFDEDFGEDPWVGQPHEEFCDLAYGNVDNDIPMLDFFTQMSDLAPNEELKENYSKLAEFAQKLDDTGGDVSEEEIADAEKRQDQAADDAYDVCVGW